MMKIEYLKMIQDVISRMANNCLKLKGWSVAVIISVLSFNNDSDSRLLLLSIIPVLSFWFYDSYYFMMEKRYRSLYNNVILKSDDDIDYDMSLDSVTVNICDTNKYSYLGAMFSKSTVWFYSTCIVTPIVIFVINNFCK